MPKTCLSGFLPLILAGCVSAHRPAPVPRGHEADLVPPSLTLRMSDGGIIPVRVWHADGPRRAAILALHGYGDSRDAWEWPAPVLMKQGIEIVAPDQRGFGQAPSRGGWPGKERMVQDAAEELRWLHAKEPDTPIYLMGESMGGAIAVLLASTQKAGALAGTILVAPAIWQFDSGPRALLAMLDLLAPNWILTASDAPGEHIATDNIVALRRLYFDPLTLHASRLHALRGLVELMADARQYGASVRTPLLALYGDRDQFIPPEAMARFWKDLPPTARRDFIHRGHHLLLRDRAGTLATQDIANWILHPECPLPSGGEIAASAWMATDPEH